MPRASSSPRRGFTKTTPVCGVPRGRELHDDLVATQLGGGGPLERPAAYFTIGSMGAGKTTTLRRFVDAHRAVTASAERTSLSRVAADDIRGALPEYRQGLGSAVVHEECLNIAYEHLYPAARDARTDLVFDTIGTIDDNDVVSFAESLRELRMAGYATHVLLADAPLDVCLKRVEQRALAVDGRLISPLTLRSLHPQPRQVLDRLRAAEDLLDGWAIFDTSTPAAIAPIVDGTDEWVGQYAQLCEALTGSGA